MTPFPCGCTDTGSERCPEHTFWCCHDGCSDVGRQHAERQCPPCRLARLRSVSLDGRATPTRRKG